MVRLDSNWAPALLNTPVRATHAETSTEKRRLVLDDELRAWIGRALETIALREAPLTREIALESPVVDLAHEDPADRFLAATARVLGLTLVTADDRLLRATSFRTLANH